MDLLSLSVGVPTLYRIPTNYLGMHYLLHGGKIPSVIIMKRILRKYALRHPSMPAESGCLAVVAGRCGQQKDLVVADLINGPRFETMDRVAGGKLYWPEV